MQILSLSSNRSIAKKADYLRQPAKSVRLVGFLSLTCFNFNQQAVIYVKKYTRAIIIDVLIKKKGKNRDNSLNKLENTALKCPQAEVCIIMLRNATYALTFKNDKQKGFIICDHDHITG